MLEFGDELGIDGYKIPWLIWIQLLILFLLIFLLFSFNFCCTSDLSNISFTSSSSSPSSSSSQPSIIASNNINQKSSAFQHTAAAATVTNRFQRPSQVRGSQSIKGEIATNKHRRIVREDAGSSSRGRNSIDYHPCNYWRLAKLAFLKCLGLDCMAESSSTSSSEQKKNR